MGYSRGTISNSYVTRTISGGSDIGGLVGYSRGSISNSYATGTISNVGNDIGGLVGELDGDISHCYAAMDVSASFEGARVGGLVGFSYHTGEISYSYATGNVLGTGNRADVGGLVGESRGKISYSYAMGDVSGAGESSIIGGLVGSSNGNISYSYATGKVSNTEYPDRCRGLAGGHQATIIHTYWDTEATGQEKTLGDGVGKTTNEMKTEATYVGWDFDSIWAIDPFTNKGYPYLDVKKKLTAIELVGFPTYEVAQMLISPNPVSRSSGAVTIYFPQNILGTGTCTIYDAQGNRIDHQEVNLARGTALQWDLCNEQGRRVAAGGYLAILQITDSMGQMHFQKAMIGVKQ